MGDAMAVKETGAEPQPGAENGAPDAAAATAEPEAEEPEAEQEPRPSDRELLRLMWPFIKPDFGLLTVGFGALFLASYSNSMTPRLLRAVIDGRTTDGVSEATVRQTMVKAATVFTLGSVGSCVRTRCFGVAAARIARRMEVAAFANMLAQDRSFFDTEKTAACVDAISTDVAACTLAVTKTAGNLLRYLSSITGGTVMILNISGRLLVQFAGMALTLVPVVAGTSMVQYKKLKRARARQAETRVMIQDFTTERLSAVSTVKAFAREDHEAQTFEAITAAAATENCAVAKAEGIMFGWLDWSVKSAGLGLVAYGSELVRQGVLSAGNLASFTMYSGLAGMGLSGLWTVYTSDWQSSTWRALRYIHKLPKPAPAGLKAPATAQGAGAASPAPPPRTLKGGVRMTDVSFTYPNRPGTLVLDKVNLELVPGQVLALTGASGCGKSTVAALLLRLYDADAGDVTYDGVPANQLDTAWLRSQIGVVEQDATLFSGTLRENIRYGLLTATDAQVEEAAKVAHAHEFISGLPNGYDTVVGTRGLQLSGGQRQRIAIARALVRQPPLLVLDEHASALDTESEGIVHQALLQAVQHRTVLMIAHSEHTLRLAHKVAVLGKPAGAPADAGCTVLKIVDPSDLQR